MSLHSLRSDLAMAGAAGFSAVEELDEANRRMGWDIEYRQLERGPFSGRFVMVESQQAVFSLEWLSRRSQVLVESPPGGISFVLPVTGGRPCRAGGSQAADGDVLLFPSGSAMEIVTWGDAGDRGLTVSQEEFVDLVLALFPGARPDLLNGAAVLPGGTHCSTPIHEEISRVVTEGSTDPEALSLLLARLAALLVRADGRELRDDLRENGTSSRVARRSRDYIESHLTEPIRMEDLCRSVGTGMRTVQRAFSAETGMPPLQYIKARRLNVARRRLAAGDPRSTSVTEIARTSGFTHFGRFSVDYRAHFGESPRETLAAR